MGEGYVVDPAVWAEMETPDVYFSKGYYETSALLEPDASESLLLEWADEGGRIRLPLILREIRDKGYFDATSAYGYGGPWIEGRPDISSFRQFFDEWARDNHVVSSFIRFHPLIGNADAFSYVFPMEWAGQTAAWDLASTTNLVEGMAKNHRKSWRRSARTGVEAKITEIPNRVDGFRMIYERSMDRLSASTYYWFSDQYWKSLRDKLGEQSLLVDATYQNRVVASVWCLVSDDYLHFHLSGTTDEGRQLGGSFICRVAAAQWGRETGRLRAHFGGGAGGTNSSLLDWKRRFDVSSPTHDFYVAKVVHDGDIFHELAGDNFDGDFFPPWRRT